MTGASEFTEGWHDTGSVKLHYVEAGRGPLVLFHHGFPSCWLSFHHQMRALCDQFRVVSVDGLGANLSSKPEDVDLYRVESLVTLVDSLARSLAGDEPFRLVGHDWGAALAWTFAQALPHRLSKVVAISAPPTNQILGMLRADDDQRARSSYMYSMREPETFARLTDTSRDRMWRLAYEPLLRLPAFTDAIAEDFRRALAEPGAIAGGINWYRANIPPIEDITDEAFWPSRHASTNVPALQIWGDDDRTFVPEFLDGLPRHASHLTVRRLDDTGHWPMFEQPDLVTTMLREFLSGA